MTDTMRAVIGEQLGGPDHYHLIEVPIAPPEPDEVQVRIHIAGMGFVDALVAQGRYQVKPSVPYCPGMEVAGVINAVGQNVTDLQVGERVTGSAFGGGLAEFINLPAASVLRIPQPLQDDQAAGFIVNYTTAWHGLLDRGSLRAGETLLVLGAAGGTGIAAVQVGRMAGARVIAGASSEEKRAFALQHGAHESIDYTDADWRKTLKEMTAGRGVDVIFDPVAGTLLEPAFRSLAWGGRHLVIGFAGGDIPALPVNLALLKGASLVGVDLRQFSSVYQTEDAAQVRAQLFDAVARGDLTPPRGTAYPLEQFRDAMALAASRDGLGKTMIRIG